MSIEDARFLVANQTEYAPNKWGPSKPLGTVSWMNRVHATLLVLFGRAAAVRWYG